jgi:hypothetical protein
MARHRIQLGGLVLLVTCALAAAAPATRGAAADTIPTRLSDVEFWRLSERLSEPDGAFRSDNLLSNELRYPEVIPDLIARVRPGGIYLGVGPEQNFNYIVALRPRMAFITDVRRGNLHVHLMYKALFELSADRAEFVSRLFTKPRPAGLTAASSATDVMNAYWEVTSSPKAVYDRNVGDIRRLLTSAPHRIPLSEEDLSGIEGVYYFFYWFGPSITYSSTSNNGFGRGNSSVTYADLMAAVDPSGQSRSYLASEEAFRFMQDLQRRNMVVPVVGNFGGPRALRAVGQYVRDHGAVISAFYLSNVEQYLRQDSIWDRFCTNVASMPLDEHSTFIRSQTGGVRGFGGGFTNFPGMMQVETSRCASPAAAGADGR